MYKIGLTSDADSLFHADVGLIDASIDGGEWSLDNAFFNTELLNQTIFDLTADAQMGLWVSSLDSGFKLEGKSEGGG